METSARLATRLKQETRGLHALAERSGVMADLMHGRISRETYCLLLRNLQPIYAALEAGLDQHQADPNVQHLWRPELRRLPALEQDLDHLHTGTNWRSDLPVLDAAAAYVERLHQHLAHKPEPEVLLLLPHAYLRYLGDLHGGQILAHVVRQRFHLPGPLGSAFYAFGAQEAPQQVEHLKHDFRAGLDALVLTPPRADAFVAEACEGFRLHAQLFDELQLGRRE